MSIFARSQIKPKPAATKAIRLKAANETIFWENHCENCCSALGNRANVAPQKGQTDLVGLP
jgi:hypothetical protein